jgi:multidrug efflux pump subunit AcrA (membrane-fusion protein)
MKLFFLLLLALLTSMGTFCWRAPLAKVSATNVAPLPVATPTVGALLGVGTVVSSYSFPLARPRRGPIRHLYVADGQYVRKGEPLLKFYDHTFLLAPMAGIVTQFPRTALDERSAAAPDYFFTARTPFRLHLSGPAKATLLAGQRVQVQSTHDPAQVVTGELLTNTADSSSQLIDLRLLTVGHEPLRAGSQVRISAVPAHT